jgi:hypothetical protein
LPVNNLATETAESIKGVVRGCSVVLKAPFFLSKRPGKRLPKGAFFVTIHKLLDTGSEYCPIRVS